MTRTARIETVGQLIETLSQYPESMPVRGSYDGMVEIIKVSDMRLDTDAEGEFWTDENHGVPCVRL